MTRRHSSLGQLTFESFDAAQAEALTLMEFNALSAAFWRVHVIENILNAAALGALYIIGAALYPHMPEFALGVTALPATMPVVWSLQSWSEMMRYPKERDVMKATVESGISWRDFQYRYLWFIVPWRWPSWAGTARFSAQIRYPVPLKS